MHADILNIEDQCVDAAQHLGRGPIGAAVEAENLNARCGIDGVADAFAIFGAGNAMFG